MRKLFFTATALVSLSTFSEANLERPFGYFVKHKNLIKSYVWSDSAPDKEDFVEYIQAKGKNVSTSDALDIAESVIKSASCFEVDARVFLGLIRMESAYQINAVSPTGAVGLTQFTSIGAREIADQLGQRGADYANPKNTRYFKSVIRNCVDKNWKNIWDRAGSKWNRQKKLFLKDIKLATTYGAMLLKLYLARHYDPNDMEKTYFNSLRDYNGEPGDRKLWYARKVLEFSREVK
jgi:hypothetical protein